MLCSEWKCTDYDHFSAKRAGTIISHFPGNCHSPGNISVMCTLFMREGGYVGCDIAECRRIFSDHICALCSWSSLKDNARDPI